MAMRKILFGALALSPSWVFAQSGSDSLVGSFNIICGSATAGSALFDRCQEIQNSPNLGAAGLTASGQRLEELPGQGRASTRSNQRDTIISTDFGDSWSLFISADIGRLKRDTSSTEAAFDGKADRLTAGINYQANQKWLLGLTLNHSRDELDFTQSASRNQSSMNGALLSASFTPSEQFSFDAYLGAFNGNSNNLRSITYTFEKSPGVPLIVNTQAFASPSTKRNLAGVSGTWQWSKSAFSGGVSLGMDQSKTRIDAYTETGGFGFALEVPKRNITSRTGYMSLSVSKAYSLDWGVIAPSLRAGLRKEFANPSRQLGVQFAQDTTNTNIVFDTSDPDTQWGEVGVGVSLVMKKGHQAFFEYRQRFAHSFLQERSLALGWRMEF
jgi:uncharacterized protein YhjY with autotransporter beta-barrel domain